MSETFETSKRNGGKGKAATKQGEGSSTTALDHRHILSALRAFKRGDFSVRMREDLTGVDGQISETFNEIVEMVKTIRDEANDISTAVGKEGQAAKRMRRLNAAGGWAEYITAVNEVIQAAQADRSAPGGARFRYATQVSTSPPTFVVFGSRQPDPTYQRFLENRLRVAFHLEGVPIRLRFRQSQGRRGRTESTE